MADDNSSWSAVESLLGDRYTREARLAPAFLCVFPIFLLVVASFSRLQSIVPALLTLLCVFGVVRWITHIARSIGDRKEMKLFRRWGGKPTTIMLRVALGRAQTKDLHLDPHILHLLGEAPRAHDIERFLATGAGPQLPAAHEDEKAAHPTDTTERADKLDSLYEPVVAWMRENSRQNKLVMEEGISYGFQRNFYALKWFAVFCGLAALGVQFLALGGRLKTYWPAPSSLAVATVVMVAAAAYIVGVLFFVSESSVKIQGFIYARQLLNSLYGAPAAALHTAAKDSDPET